MKDLNKDIEDIINEVYEVRFEPDKINCYCKGNGITKAKIKALIQEEVKERDKLIADIKEVRKNKEGYIFEVVLIRIDELITKYEERG